MPRASVIRTLDLFAGAGGLSVGLHAADKRFKPILAVEMDVAAAATFATTFRTHVYAGKIEDWLVDEDVPDVDVVAGGPPCQGFSSLGRQDAADARNTLWSQYAETVRRATPRYFIMENVPQFLHSPEFELFRRSTEPGGKLEDYDFNAFVLNSAHFGAAQVRKRTIVVGWHRDLPPLACPSPRTSTRMLLCVRFSMVSHKRLPKQNFPILTSSSGAKHFPAHSNRLNCISPDDMREFRWSGSAGFLQAEIDSTSQIICSPTAGAITSLGRPM